MYIDFSYDELLAMSSALHTIENVFGYTEERSILLEKIDEQLSLMDNSPVTEVYPNIVVALADCEV